MTVAIPGQPVFDMIGRPTGQVYNKDGFAVDRPPSVLNSVASTLANRINLGPAGRGTTDGIQMPSPDYMRMLTDFQKQGGSVGENATKKLAEAQAIIDTNQAQVTQTTQSQAYQDLLTRRQSSQGQDQDANRQLQQFQQQFGNIMGGGNQQQPFSYVGSGYRYDDYDPATNTVSHNQSGIAGNMDMGRVSVADLMNDEGFAGAFNQFQNQAQPAAGSGGNQQQQPAAGGGGKAGGRVQQAPNINQSAARGIQGAMAGAAREMQLSLIHI